MKVLHIFNELKFSGAEVMYVDAATKFQNYGYELYALSTGKELGEYAPFFEKAGYRVLHKSSPNRYDLYNRLLFIHRIHDILRREKIDVVHIHSSRRFFDMSMIAWFSGINSVYTFHNVFKTKKYTYLYYLIKRWVAKNLFKCKFQTISDSVYQNEKNVFKNNTTLIYNWYGSTRFFPAEKNEKQTFRNELDIPENANVLISVGGCSNVKRHSEILKALPIILKSVPDCIYLHLGIGTTLAEEKELADKLKINKHVRFYGNQSDVRKFLIASDIYLMPSRFEGIPITTIETMACKIPSILYNVPGLKDFNQTGLNSILIPEDYFELANQVVLLTNDVFLKEKITANAYDFVINKFSMENNVSKLVYLYK